MSLRETLNQKPWIGYILVAVLVAGGFVLYMKLSGSNDPNSVEKLSETVTIKDSETGDEWTMSRGLMELQLITASANGPLDPKQGLKNPKTGKMSGFPIESSWEATIKRINAERAAQSQTPPTAPTPPAKKGN